MARFSATARDFKGAFSGGWSLIVAAGTSAPSKQIYMGPGPATITLPVDPRPLKLVLTATTKSTEFWPVIAELTFTDDGGLQLAQPSPAGVRVASSGFANAGSEGASAQIEVQFSRAVDATANALQALHHPAPNQVKGFVPPTSWQLKQDYLSCYVEPFDPASAKPTLGADVHFERRGIVLPNTIECVLELRHVEVPKYLAISWPRRITLNKPLPFLLYLRPHIGQKGAPDIKKDYLPPGQHYPTGFGFVEYVFDAYRRYYGDPLTAWPFAKGLPYQIAASQKDTILVQPMNCYPPPKDGEFGSFMKADAVELMLKEIAWFFATRHFAQAFTPNIGRTALAAFSSGNFFVTAFLAANRSHKFCREILQEIFNFDLPTAQESNLVAWTDATIAWLGQGDEAARKCVRVYTQTAAPPYQRLLGAVPLVAGKDIVLHSKPAAALTSGRGGNRTVARFSPSFFIKACHDKGGNLLKIHGLDKAANKEYQAAHQCMSALMLTDAMRRSGF
jgi:hypothetical protein